MSDHPIRVVLAKLGLDGHDRGIQVVARGLRDAGMEVIYTGLWQDVAAVVRAVGDEDADVLGISLLSGAHLTIVPELIKQLQEAGLERVVVVVGGIIPEEDVSKLQTAGVAKVFTPGAAMDDISASLRHAVRAAS